jgi:16S rRNA (cytosine967-C5)-methyltransferase
MIAPARVRAYDGILDVMRGRADLPAALEHMHRLLPERRDRALAAEIMLGAERQRAALDHLIGHYSRRPLDRLDPQVVAVLRISLYQLLHLARVPASAVVDDAVELTRKAGKSSATGLVNAVLRAVSRTPQARLPLPPRPGSGAGRGAALAYLSVTLSHPAWLAERWHDRYGFEVAERWMQFNNTPPPLTLRVNRLCTTPADLQIVLRERGFPAVPGRFAPDALLIEGRTGLPDGLDAAYLVQDEASQLVALLAGNHPGAWVLDACAAPGGKATAIAQAAAHVVACDIRARRVRLLRQTIARTGASNVHVVQMDSSSPPPFRRSFDTVIVDAPCSGLGTLRRDPDIRWRRQPADLPAFARVQTELLAQAALSVRPGGRLVYATCSSEPEENEQVAAAFLERAPAFAPFDARRAHPGLPSGIVGDDGYLRTLPDRHGLEAFFGAVFERRSL